MIGLGKGLPATPLLTGVGGGGQCQPGQVRQRLFQGLPIMRADTYLNFVCTSLPLPASPFHTRSQAVVGPGLGGAV